MTGSSRWRPRETDDEAIIIASVVVGGRREPGQRKVTGPLTRTTPAAVTAKCPSQGLRGSGSTACVLASGAFVQTCTNGDWLLQQDASVVPQNRLRTMSSITAQSIGLHMVCMV